MDPFRPPQLIEGFLVHDIDDATDPAYYGYVNARGAWYIMINNVASKTYRYARGTSDYSASWTGRAGLSYNYIDRVFAS